MPISTSLILTTKNGNKIKTQNITYANPNAADSDLATFTAALCSLSNNEFVSLNRLDKHELTLQLSKPSPNLTLTGDSNFTGTTVAFTVDSMNIHGGTPNPSSALITASRQGNGAITATSNSSNFSLSVNGTEITITPGGGAGKSNYNETAAVTVTCAETSEYASDTATFTVEYTYTYGVPAPDMPEP